jgi:DNA/RNA endonuclease G (NUC1)
MEHPLISNIDHLTEAELIDKITELNKKYYACMHSGNSQLANQVGLAIETYRNKLTEKQTKHRPDGDFKDKIDIS